MQQQIRQLRDAVARIFIRQQVSHAEGRGLEAGTANAAPTSAYNRFSTTPTNDMPVFYFENDKKYFNKEFIKLIEEKNGGKVISIIKNYPAEVLVDNDGTHLLHLLAKFNNCQVIDFCIKSNYKLDVEDLSGNTPIMTAVFHENFFAARTLHKAYTDASDKKSVRRNICPIMATLRIKRNDDSLLKKQQRYSHLQVIVSKFKAKGVTSKEIGRILAKLFYCLNDVVSFCEPAMTKAFLQHRDILYFGKSGLDEVVATYDWEHIKVLIDHQPLKVHSLMFYFIDLLINNISEYHKSEEGKNFLKQAFTWEILSAGGFEHFEEILQRASTKNVAIFLQYGFHTVVKATCGKDILEALFGNPYLDLASLLKNEKIDVHRRYRDEKTALHIAADRTCPKNIQWLLEKGADPNALDSNQNTPLSLVLNNTQPDKDCAERLLLGGADPSIVSNNLTDGIFHTDVREFMKFNTGIAFLIAAHLAIKKELCLPIERAIEEYKCFSREHMQNFLEKRVQEANELKNYTIRDAGKYRQTTVTMFTLLVEKPEKSAYLLRKEDLRVVNDLLIFNLFSWNPYYHKALKKRATDIVQINHLRHKATLFTSKFTGIGDPQHLVVQKIVQYLSFTDLRLFQ